MKKPKLFLVLIIILASFLRLWQLGNIPMGFAHDELGYSFNAYSIAKTGNNLFGEHLPFLTWVAKGDAFLPTTMYLSSAFYSVFPYSRETARLPDAILGIADVFLVYILAFLLFKNQKLALFSSFFLAISPWHLHFSRSGYDVNFALFFYLLSVTLFVKEINNKKMPLFSLLSLLSLFLGIFTYRGMSAMAFPLFLVMLFYAFFIKAKKNQIVALIVGGIAIFSIFFGVILKVGQQNYSPEATTLLNDPKMQEYIDTQARDAKGPLLLKRVFINKPMYLLSKLRENYFKIYSLDFLFLHTEARETYSIWSRGRIYFLDSIFILLGFLFFARLRKKESLLPFLLLAIGGIPAALAGSPVSARSFFLSSIFPIFSAGGVLFIMDFLKNNQKKIFITLVIVSYLFLLSSYLFDYYARYANQGAESWGKSFKDVSSIVNKNKNKSINIVLEKVTFGDFIEYAFYSRIKPEDIQGVYKNKSSGEYRYQNIVFSENCKIPQSQSLYVVSSQDCFKNDTPYLTINDYYGNIIWRIYKL